MPRKVSEKNYLGASNIALFTRKIYIIRSKDRFYVERTVVMRMVRYAFCNAPTLILFEQVPLALKRLMRGVALNNFTNKYLLREHRPSTSVNRHNVNSMLFKH